MRTLNFKMAGIFWLLVISIPHSAHSQYFLEIFSCGNTMPNVCGGVIDCPNWQISHGSPRIDGGAVLMERYVSSGGEGIFARYPFLAGRSYTITYTARVAGNNLLPLVIRASNGLNDAPHNSGDPCTEPEPIVVSALISSEDVGDAWTTHTEPFNPTNNYTQIWLYIGGGLSRPMWVDDIEIEQVCQNDQVFSNSAVIPNGLTEVEDFIWAGSKQNGSTSGLVTSGVNNQTELKAGDHIFFSEDFQSCPSASGYMVAGIADCGQNFSFKKENGSISIREPIHNESIEKLTVLQNLSTGHPTLKLKLEMERDVGVMVINEIGQVMYSADGARMPAGENQIAIPTHQLKSGLYIALVKVGEENLTGKFIIP